MERKVKQVDDFVEPKEFSESENGTAYIKCEGCGSNMTFDPQTQSLKCEHCGRIENFEKCANVLEIELENAVEESAKWDDEVSVYRCDNCGASFSVDASQISVFCPYCSTSHVVKEENLSGIKPNVVYPFALTKQTAVLASRKWAKRRVFAPRKFKKNLVEDNLHGIYQPCFTFDSDTQTYYDGVLGERRTRTVRNSKGETHTETYIHWKHVSGYIDRFFDDVTVSCGKMSQGELDKLMPFNKQTACVYKKEFLSGYAASHYTRDIKICWTDAKKMIDGSLRQTILKKHNCDVVRYLNLNTRHLGVTYKYVLFPIYRLNYRFKNKDYPIMINGNNGKVTGKTPVSPLRVGIVTVFVIAFIIALIWAFAYN